MTISSLSSIREGPQQLEPIQWNPGEEDTPSMVTNDRIYAILADATTIGCGINDDNAIGGYRTELDSHANMPVLG